ncbi:uncharacterized protein Dsimw501_GD25783, isoform B [Drosophila simulans]|uniref:Uncharacterized protein, isoform B n=1 Tax=Drosophila simulans TaxID=7240 RepID=A0A0J9RBP2_DROSI|nr:uncharacterized protein Dsimw501_GD25783, isoform B [Drosophila simulans]
MGIPTIKKCCCLELKWGALIAVVVDFFFGSIVFFDADSERRSINIALYVLVLVYIAHIVCMILVLVSLCVFLQSSCGSSSSRGTRSLQAQRTHRSLRRQHYPYENDPKTLKEPYIELN